jgi:hypothetical protein
MISFEMLKVAVAVAVAVLIKNGLNHHVHLSSMAQSMAMNRVLTGHQRGGSLCNVILLSPMTCLSHFVIANNASPWRWVLSLLALLMHADYLCSLVCSHSGLGNAVVHQEWSHASVELGPINHVKKTALHLCPASL